MKVRKVPNIYYLLPIILPLDALDWDLPPENFFVLLENPQPFCIWPVVERNKSLIIYIIVINIFTIIIYHQHE